MSKYCWRSIRIPFPYICLHSHCTLICQYVCQFSVIWVNTRMTRLENIIYVMSHSPSFWPCIISNIFIYLVIVAQVHNCVHRVCFHWLCFRHIWSFQYHLKSFVPNLFTIGTSVWHIFDSFEFATQTPLKCPLGIEGLLWLAYFHFLMNLYTCAKFGPDRSRGLEAFPDLLIDDPLTPMPLVYKGLMFSSCPFPDEYAYVSQICSRSVQLFGFFATFWNVWPPDPLQMPLGALWVNCLAYVHSMVNMYTCAKFLYPDRSSGLTVFPDL